jgi:hypothetical protein
MNIFEIANKQINKTSKKVRIWFTILILNLFIILSFANAQTLPKDIMDSLPIEAKVTAVVSDKVADMAKQDATITLIWVLTAINLSMGGILYSQIRENGKLI